MVWLNTHCHPISAFHTHPREKDGRKVIQNYVTVSCGSCKTGSFFKRQWASFSHLLIFASVSFFCGNALNDTIFPRNRHHGRPIPTQEKCFFIHWRLSRLLISSSAMIWLKGLPETDGITPRGGFAFTSCMADSR